MQRKSHEFFSVRLSRRTFLQQSGAAMFAAGATSAWMPAAKAAIFGIPVGLQLYTVNAEMEKDFEGTLRAVAAIGYRQVELPGYYGRKAGELRAALDSVGLKCDSGMFPMQSKPGMQNLLDHRQQCIDFAGKLGLKYLITPFMHLAQGLKDLQLDDFKRNAELFNRIGEQTRKAGIQFGFHNHNVEFRKFDGVIGFDELLRLTDPQLVTMEMDCGWVTAAGHDPARYLAKYPGRFSLLHIKDLKADRPNTDLKMTSVEAGRGVIDWKKVLIAAQASGVKAGFVEQEAPFIRPALESAKLSYEFLQTLKRR